MEDDAAEFDLAANALLASNGSAPKGPLAKQAWAHFVNLCRAISFASQHPTARGTKSRSTLRSNLLHDSMTDMIVRLEALTGERIECTFDGEGRALFSSTAVQHAMRSSDGEAPMRDAPIVTPPVLPLHEGVPSDGGWAFGPQEQPPAYTHALDRHRTLRPPQQATHHHHQHAQPQQQLGQLMQVVYRPPPLSRGGDVGPPLLLPRAAHTYTHAAQPQSPSRGHKCSPHGWGEHAGAGGDGPVAPRKSLNSMTPDELAAEADYHFAMAQHVSAKADAARARAMARAHHIASVVAATPTSSSGVSATQP